MGRTKTAAVKAAKDSQVKAISSVKEGAITKPSQTPKSKSKEIAKQVVVKVGKSAKGEKTTKKSKKEPTPEPSSPESESDATATSVSSASSEDESESEVESKPAVVSNGIKSNGAVKPVAAAKKNGTVTRSSESESEGDSDDGSDSEEESKGSEDESDEDLAVPGAVDSKALNGALEKVAASQQVRHNFTRTFRYILD